MGLVRRLCSSQPCHESHHVFTTQQQKALEFQHHLSVTANAGAGKTTVLVQRFVDILIETGIPVKQLVAITFTEKAASELRRKIAARVGEKLRAATRPDERNIVERIRDQLSSANIGTIHSFCAQLLREFPIEADVDAAFTVLEGVDRQFLEQEAIREAFDSVLKHSADRTEREEVLEVIRILGRRTTQSYLAAFLKKREHMSRLLQDDGLLYERKSDEEVIGFWRDSIDQAIAAALDDPQWISSMGNILGIATGKSANEVLDLFHQWEQSLSLDTKKELYCEILSSTLTQKGTIRKDLVGSKIGTESVRNDEQFLANHLKSIECFLTGSDNRDASNRVLLRVLRTILKLYKGITDRYTLRKYENGQLDFDDLQLHTRALLRQEHIRHRLTEKYSYIMVDEYQDTNQLQYEILRLLIENFTKGNLFIVGDPKQSIYGFRNADVEIFEVTRSDIRKAIGIAEDGNVTLAESFRLLPALVDFVNRVFSHTMENGATRFDVRYDELVCGRAHHGEGRVELLLVPPDEKKETGTTNRISLECHSLGRRIVDLVESRYEVVGVGDDKPHPCEFRDCAILLRGRAHLLEIEKALVELRIPYQLSGGIGFYQTQEVFDFLNYFSFLLNPDDDVALAGVLRSPFFAVSDPELFEISLLNANGTLWDKVLLHARRSIASREIIRADELLQEDLQVANRLPIPFLVQRIFRQTGWRGTVSGLMFGEQNSANILKLLRIAREFEGKGFLALYDFVERLRTLASHEEREGQAALEPSGNCVQIMTIHAAKGLEFPVVFLPFSHQHFRYDEAPYIDQVFGIGIKVKDPQDYNTEVVPDIFHFLQQRSRAKTDAEEKRIFYVGCTRARDMLIVSGLLNRDSSRPSFLGWIVAGLGLDAVTVQPGSLVFPPVKMKVLDQKGETSTALNVDHSLSLYVSFSRGPVAPWDQGRREIIETAPARPNQTRSLIAHVRGEVFSASQIRTYIECPAKFYLKYCLGLPEQNVAPYPFDEGEDANDRIRGETAGALTHRILEEVPGPNYNIEKLRERAEHLVTIESSIPQTHRSLYVKSIMESVSDFLGTRFAKQFLAASETMLEYSLTQSLGHDFITGTIDRLYRGADSQWRIVDYKTDDIPFRAIHDRAEIYRPQLATYAFLLSRFFRQASVETAIVFLKHPDSPVEDIFSDAELRHFEEKLLAIIEGIREKKFEPRVSQCSHCSYAEEGGCVLFVKK